MRHRLIHNTDSVSIYSHPHESTIINGSTFWSDSAYIRYESISAYRSCDEFYEKIGSQYSGAIIEIPSSAISSICGLETIARVGIVRATPFPFNFYDLVGDIPVSAYDCKSSSSMWQ
jgi:hypothetical protein